MTCEEAVTWVDENKGMIINQAKQYTTYTPYSVDDYVQDAYTAAVESVYCCKNNPKLIFEAVFRITYRRIIARVTPFPDAAREENKRKKAYILGQEDCCIQKSPPRRYYSGGTSASFADNMRNDVDLENIADCKSRPKVDLEKVYMERVRGNLSPKEQDVMDLAIGVTLDGTLSYSEIGVKLGLSRENAKKRVSRTIDKIVGKKLLHVGNTKETAPKFSPQKRVQFTTSFG